MRVFLVRHAKAGTRGSGPGDRRRALSDEGSEQALALAEHFDGERIERILTSPYPRCMETVAPLAERRGLELEVVESLGEGNSAATAFALLRSLGDVPSVVCSHGDVIPDLLHHLRPQLELSGDTLQCPKASTWALDGDLDGVLAASYRPPPSTWSDAGPQRLAVLDMGSTSFHLVVADVFPDGSIERVTRERVMLRLGALIRDGQAIPADVSDRVVDTAVRLSELATEVSAVRLLPIATAAFRDASNGELLARRVGDAVGEPVHVLSGREEAHAMFSAFRRRIGLGPELEFGWDLGGGSLELAIGDASGVHWETTLPLGAVRIERELDLGDQPGAAARDAVFERVDQELAPHLGALDARELHGAIGSGGTVRALGRLVLARDPGLADAKVGGLVLSGEMLRHLSLELLSSAHEERLAMPGMDARRVDILPVGSAIVDALVEELGFEELTISDWGVREGILLDAAHVRHSWDAE